MANIIKKRWLVKTNLRVATYYKRGKTMNEEKNITDDDIAHAREIFFTYIDNPDMLKIKRRRYLDRGD